MHLHCLTLIVSAAFISQPLLASSTYTVDPSHPATSDNNPGTTDKPWQTLAHAAKQAQPGDTVLVMPGIYEESVVVRGDGAENPEPTRFIASGDGPAIIEGGTILTAKDLESTNVPGVFAWKPPAPLSALGVNRTAQPMAWVFINGVRTLIKREGDLTTEDTFAFTRSKDLITINPGSTVWPADQEILVSHRANGFTIENRHNVHLQGFEFRHQAGNAIEVNGSNGTIIEDCHIVRPNMHGIYVNASRGITARRNRVFEPHAWASNFKGQGHLVEENVFQTTGSRNEPAAEAWVGVLKFNGGSFITARHNFLADRPPSEVALGPGRSQKNTHVFGGIWGDIHCYDNRIYGNSVSRQGHTGIYLEFLTNRATVMWNVLQDNAVGISTRQSSGNIIRQNWIFDTAALWGRDSVDLDNMPTFKDRPLDHPEWARERLDGINLYQTANDRASKNNLVIQNLLQLTGRPISIPVPREMDKASREDVARFMMITPEEVPEDLVLDIDYTTVPDSFNSPLNNYIDNNFYVWSPERAFAGFAWFPDRQIDSFEAYRKATGFDAHSQIGDFSPDVIGLQIGWTLQADSRKPDLPLPFDYDGGAERAIPVGRAMFGRGIWLDLPPEPYSWFRAMGASTQPGPGPGKGRWASDPTWKNDPRQWTRLPAARSGMRALGVINPSDPAAIPAEGLGWRTASIPVTEGIEFDVSLWIKGDKIEPAQKGQGSEVVIVFTDWTGHNRQEVKLVGGDASPTLQAGTFDWTEVSRRFAVPAGAKRMIVYAGLRPATGSLLIDDLTLSMVLPETLTPQPLASTLLEAGTNTTILLAGKPPLESED